LISPSFLYLINNVCRDKDTPEAQFDFILSIRGYIELAQWSPVLCGVVKAFYQLAWQAGVMQRLTWADALLDEIQDIAVTLTVEEPEYKSLYPVDLQKAEKSVEARSITTLVKEFKELRLQDGEVSNADSIGNAEGSADEAEGQTVWTGDPRDLSLTLSEAVCADELADWDSS